MGLSFLFALMAAWMVWIHADTGIRYLLLDRFGTQIEARVISEVCNADPQEFASEVNNQPSVRLHPDDPLRARRWLGSHVELTYEDQSGATHTFRGLPLNCPAELQTGDRVPLLYWERNPAIALPSVWLADFAFDATIMVWAFIGFCGCLVVGGVAIAKWRAFKIRMRRY
ncbi:MAG: hypothetical protein AAF940_05050 [Pseudomonadota bacterium]